MLYIRLMFLYCVCMYVYIYIYMHAYHAMFICSRADRQAPAGPRAAARRPRERPARYRQDK